MSYVISSFLLTTLSSCTAETIHVDCSSLCPSPFSTVVRLGEHNLTSEIDCDNRSGRRICAPRYQDFVPVEVTQHPSFNVRDTMSDDIALIRLDRDVDFNSECVNACISYLPVLPSFMSHTSVRRVKERFSFLARSPS